MEKFTTLTAVAAPLPADNIDTDQLMPKQFLHGIDKSGLAQGLLYNLRFDGNVGLIRIVSLISRALKKPKFLSPVRTSAAAQAASMRSGG